MRKRKRGLNKLIKTVEQKIGRNVLLFQQMEALLKHLLACSNISGPFDEIANILEKRGASVDKQTMGYLVEQFKRNVLSGAQEVSPAAEEIIQGWVTSIFQINVEVGSPEHQSLEESMTSIVQKRNALIHQLLPILDLSSIDGANTAIQYLDEQHQQILPTFTQLKSFVNFLYDSNQAITAYIASDCFKEDMARSSLEIQSSSKMRD